MSSGPLLLDTVLHKTSCCTAHYECMHHSVYARVLVLLGYTLLDTLVDVVLRAETLSVPSTEYAMYTHTH